MSQMKQLAKRSSYETLPLQRDIPACFFIDRAANVCGIIFNGCEQFACPFENLVDMTISTNGQGLDYSGRTPVVGAGRNMFMFGSLPQARMMNPSIFDVNFVFLASNETPMNYHFTLFSNGRVYVTHDGTANTPEKLAFFDNIMSAATMRQLTDIQASVSAIKEIGKMIRNGTIPAPPIDIEKYKKNQEAAKETEKQNSAELSSMFRKSVLKFFIKLGIAILVIALLVFGLYMCCR